MEERLFEQNYHLYSSYLPSCCFVFPLGPFVLLFPLPFPFFFFFSLLPSSMSDTSTSVTSAEGKVDASVSVNGVSLPVWVVAAGSTLFSFSSGFSLNSDFGVSPGSSTLALWSSLVSCCSDSGTKQSF